MDLGLALIIVVLIATPAIAYTVWLVLFQTPEEPKERKPAIFRRPPVARRVNSQDKYRAEYAAKGFRTVDLERRALATPDADECVFLGFTEADIKRFVEAAVVSVPVVSAPKKTYAPPVLTKHCRPALRQLSAAPAAKPVETLPRRRTRRNL